MDGHPSPSASTDDDPAQEDAQTAYRYFSSFAEDYHRAFRGGGQQPLHALINRLFRRKTFQKRTEVVERFLKAHGLAGKRVLDLGCGSGEVSLVAARLGARVVGLDQVEAMVALARREAETAGLADATEFRVQDVIGAPLPPADVTMMVSIIEYYRDLEPLLGAAAAATRELLVLVDTRGPWWRRTLRHVLARLKRFSLYYHSPARVSAALAHLGFREQARVEGHSFTAFAFRRSAGNA